MTGKLADQGEMGDLRPQIVTKGQGSSNSPDATDKKTILCHVCNQRFARKQWRQHASMEKRIHGSDIYRRVRAKVVSLEGFVRLRPCLKRSCAFYANACTILETRARGVEALQKFEPLGCSECKEYYTSKFQKKAKVV